MRVLVVSAVFPPEPTISGRGSADIADALAGRGHSVTVIAPFPSRPGGRLYPGFRRRLFARSRLATGVEIVRCFSTLSRQSTMGSRLLEWVSFGITGGVAAAAARRPDVIYTNSWPVVATGILALVARIRGIPLVMTVQDVYPESLVAQGRIRADGVLARSVRAVDGWIARSCAAVLPISERFATLYAETRGVPRSRLRVVANWLRAPKTDPSDSAGAFRRERGIAPNEFVAVYGGNVGVAAGVDTLIQAFRRLDENHRMHLVIAGEGSELEACRRLASDASAGAAAGRIHFESPWPADRTDAVLGAGDVLLLPTRGRQSLASVPSKLIAYLLAGRPVIAMADPESDLADAVVRSGAGWLAPPDDPDAFAVALGQAFDAGPAERARRGAEGKAFALAEMTDRSCLPRVIDALENAAGAGTFRGTPA